MRIEDEDGRRRMTDDIIPLVVVLVCIGAQIAGMYCIRYEVCTQLVLGVPGMIPGTSTSRVLVACSTSTSS